MHWKIGGEAGKGVKSSGHIFALMCTRGGLHAFGYTEYPSLIKGGHNTFQVRVEESPVLSLIKKVNILVALDKKTVDLHKDEVGYGGVVLYDEDVLGSCSYGDRAEVRFLHVPAKKIASDMGASGLLENQVFLGATCALLDYDLGLLQSAIADEYRGKEKRIIDLDLVAAKAGFDHISAGPFKFSAKLVPKEMRDKLMFLTGNDAVALGALKGGLKFFAAYPMTPASSILHTLASLQEECGIGVKHAEDEISVINMVVGAGFAGVRAMCATSGGGFALMNEGYSLAAMTETPLVIVEVMRGGPATGLPTWTEQGDLKFVLNAGHGEFPRFVIAPGDVEEAFYLTAEALNIAEKYQTPVVVVMDRYLAESYWSYAPFSEDVLIDRGEIVSDDQLASLEAKGERNKRYVWSVDSGVSPRVFPGQHPNGIFLANSDEHDEFGYSTEEIGVRNKMHGKRMAKAVAFSHKMPKPRVYGPEDADLTIVCWGSTKTVALQALDWLNAEGFKVNVLHLNYVSPFPKDAVLRILSDAKIVLDVEQNSTGQMAEVIRAHTSFEIKHHLLQNDGRPIVPERILDAVKGLLEGGR